MNLTDPVGDMLTRIRNAQARGKESVETPASVLRGRVLEVLRDEGYISGYERIEKAADGHPALRIDLRYHEGEPVIREIARVSKPGRRVYAAAREIPVIYNGLGVTILSTSRGVMSDNAARSANVGGEVLCRVF